MKKKLLMLSSVAIVAAAVVAIVLGAQASDLPFVNLFKQGFAGYTSDEGQILTPDFISSQQISVSAGEDVWFGPCDPGQYFHLVGQNDDAQAVTDKIRGKDLEVADTFNNGMVIYRYTVPEGVTRLVITAQAEMAEVYAVSKTEISELTWRAYWNQSGVNTENFVGKSSYYELVAGDKLYFGAVTLEDATSSKLYDDKGGYLRAVAQEDLRLVESFGGDFGLYCFTAPADAGYVYVTYDSGYEDYYVCTEAGQEEISDAAILADFIRTIGVPQPTASTVEKLTGKTALFLGDSITFGARDRANIYGAGGWAGRIGY